MKRFLKPIFVFLKNLVKIFKVRGKQKIFCIGLNKTGTTSLRRALNDLGVIVANEAAAKVLFYDWAKRDFNPIFKYCRTAQAFQDSPFSFPYTYIALDQKYPNSKFILSVRASDEEWYRSITHFHSKLWADNDGIPPTEEQLKNAVNSYKGRPWEVNRVLFNTPESEPYEKKELLDFYNKYNDTVIDYFKTRPNKLLVINLAEKGSYNRFLSFLGYKSEKTDFPWENKT